MWSKTIFLFIGSFMKTSESRKTSTLATATDANSLSTLNVASVFPLQSSSSKAASTMASESTFMLSPLVKVYLRLSSKVPSSLLKFTCTVAVSLSLLRSCRFTLNLCTRITPGSYFRFFARSFLTFLEALTSTGLLYIFLKGITRSVSCVETYLNVGFHDMFLHSKGASVSISKVSRTESFADTSNASANVSSTGVPAGSFFSIKMCSPCKSFLLTTSVT